MNNPDNEHKNNKELLNAKDNYVVIGNGFDLSVGLKSSYNHFLDDVIKQYELKSNEEIFDFNNLFVREFHGRELNWSDFETIFETQMIEINESLEYSKHDQIKNYRVNRLNEDLKKLEKMFYHYIKKEYSEWKIKTERKSLKINPFYLKLFSDEKTHIMTFNFTKVLDYIFEGNKIKKDRIYQLHGSLEDNNIILGGGFTGSDGISKVSLEGSLTNDKLVRIKKDSLLFFKREKLISKVNRAENNSFNLFILGHSIMGSDFIFLQPFFEKAEKIYMFYFDQDFSYKLQFFIKQLGREFAEKIYLVPFFDVLSTNNCNVVIKGLDQYNLVKEVFNFPVPQDEESSNLFEDIQLYSSSFMLQNIKQIKITSVKELEKILDIFEKLDPKGIRLQDNFFINIDGVDDPTTAYILLSNLFKNLVYKKSVKKASKVEITNCTFNWNDFGNSLKENELEELVLKDNTILYKQNEDSFDISKLTKLKYLTFEENEFQLQNETNEEKQKQNSFKFFNIELRNPLNYLYRIIILGNQGMRVGESFCKNDIKSKIVKIEIDSTVERLCFPEVEYLELKGLDTLMPEIKVNNKVNSVKLNDFNNEKLIISTLFNSKDNQLPQLPKLQEFAVNNMPLKELYSNVLCNVFDFDPVLKCNSNEKHFSEILKNQIIDIKVNNLMELFDSSNTEMMNNKNSGSNTIIQTKLLISDDESQSFSKKWHLRYEDLVFLIKNYNTDLNLNDQNGFQDLRRKENYERYKLNGGEIQSFLEYRKQFTKELEALIELAYSVEETKNEHKKIYQLN